MTRRDARPIRTPNGVAVRPPVLITGATGRVGRVVVDLLIEAGVPVRVLTHRPEAAATLPANVEVVAGDVTVPESLAAGLAGAVRRDRRPTSAGAPAPCDRRPCDGADSMRRRRWAGRAGRVGLAASAASPHGWPQAVGGGGAGGSYGNQLGQVGE